MTELLLLLLLLWQRTNSSELESEGQVRTDIRGRLDEKVSKTVWIVWMMHKFITNAELEMSTKMTPVCAKRDPVKVKRSQQFYHLMLSTSLWLWNHWNLLYIHQLSATVHPSCQDVGVETVNSSWDDATLALAENCTFRNKHHKPRQTACSQFCSLTATSRSVELTWAERCTLSELRLGYPCIYLLSVQGHSRSLTLHELKAHIQFPNGG